MIRILLSSFMFTFLLIVNVGCDTCEQREQPRTLSDQVEHKGKHYYMFTRSTGFQDIVYYFELYEEKPVFDKCGKPSVKPIYTVAYDDYPVKQYVKSIILQPQKEEKLNIIYTKNIDEAMDINTVKFTGKK